MRRRVPGRLTNTGRRDLPHPCGSACGPLSAGSRGAIQILEVYVNCVSVYVLAIFMGVYVAGAASFPLGRQLAAVFWAQLIPQLKPDLAGLLPSFSSGHTMARRRYYSR